MTPFTVVSGVAALLARDNIDTDIIIPVPFLRHPQEDLARGLFHNLRFGDDERETDFILNRQGFRSASVLISGRNFGCGSSREHAVWALLAFGIRVVVAASFGDIFYGNCVRMGLLPVALQDDSLEPLTAVLAAADEPPTLTVSLVDQCITDSTGRSYAFAINPLHREMLLEGKDAIALALAQEDAIAEFQDTDRKSRPWVYR